MVTYPENVQRNRWLGILDLILRTGNGVLEGLPGPPVVGGGCDSIQNGGQIRINPPPRLCHQVPRCWPHTTACRSPGHGIGRPGLMVTYPENVQRNRWLGILDLILRTGNGVLEGLPGPPVVVVDVTASKMADCAIIRHLGFPTFDIVVLYKELKSAMIKRDSCYPRAIPVQQVLHQ